MPHAHNQDRENAPTVYSLAPTTTPLSTAPERSTFTSASSVQTSLAPQVAVTLDSEGSYWESLSQEERRRIFSKRLKDLSHALVGRDGTRNTTFIKVIPTQVSTVTETTPSSVDNEVAPGAPVPSSTNTTDDSDTVMAMTIRSVESMGHSTADGTGEPPSLTMWDSDKNTGLTETGVDETFDTNAAYMSPSHSFDGTLTTGSYSQYTGTDGTFVSNTSEQSNFVSNLWHNMLFSCSDSVSPFSLGEQVQGSPRFIFSRTQNDDEDYKEPINPCTTPMVGHGTGNCVAPTCSASEDSSQDRRSYHSREATRFGSSDMRQTSFSSSDSSQYGRRAPTKNKAARRRAAVPVSAPIDHAVAKRFLRRAVEFHGLSADNGNGTNTEPERNERLKHEDDSTISTKFSMGTGWRL